MILGGHLQLGGRHRDGQYYTLLTSNGIGEVVQKVEELNRQPALAVAADVVHQFIHQDEARLVTWQKLPDDIPRRRDHLRLMLGHDGKPFRAAQPEGDLAPRRLPQGRPVGAPAPGQGIEFGSHEDGRSRRIDFTARAER